MKAGARRVTATAAILLFALASLLSGGDRVAATNSSISAHIPESVRAFAWRSSAHQALAMAEPGKATKEATRAVSANPFDYQAVSLLAASLVGAGERRQAEAAFAAADALGLRSPLAQAYFFDIAIEKGDANEAAARLHLLLLAHPEIVGEGYFFDTLEANAAGRDELAKRLANDPLWAGAYLSAFGQPNDVLLARAGFLADSGAAASLGCDRMDPMLRELAKRNLRADAHILARAACPTRLASQALADAGFEAFGSDEAFGWRRHSSGDVRISSVGVTDQQVEMENRAATMRLVLSQPVALGEGEYRIFGSVAAERPDTVVISLDCGEPRRPTRGAGSLGRGQLVRAEPCSNQVLGIWLKPRSGSVRLDNLRLESVGAQDRATPSISAE